MRSIYGYLPHSSKSPMSAAGRPGYLRQLNPWRGHKAPVVELCLKELALNPTKDVTSCECVHACINNKQN